jgi:hypothetical protein
MTEVCRISTHTAALLEEHPPKRQEERRLWAIEQLKLRPHVPHWRKVIWCDELHWKTGPPHPRKIKRRAGKAERFKPLNVQTAYNHKPDKESKKKERRFHLFCVVSYNFA